MNYIILISRIIYNNRLSSKLLWFLKLDYNKFFRFIGRTNNNLDLEKTKNVRRRIYGVVFELDLYKPTERSIFFEGIYERENLKFAMDSIKENSVFVDVGAHIGYYSLLLGEKIMKSGGSVLSFEPSSENFSKLTRNINLNISLKNKIRVFPYALSNVNGEKTLFLNPYNDGGNSLEKFSYAPLAKQVVRCIRFDDFHETMYSHIDFVKIDVEGHEMEVLLGMKQTISTHHPSLLIEAQTKKEQDNVIEFLNTLGYSSIHSNKNHTDLLCRY